MRISDWTVRRIKYRVALGMWMDYDWYLKPHVFSLQVDLIFFYIAVEVEV